MMALPYVPLEAGFQGQGGRLTRLRVHQHFRSVYAVKSESRTVDIGSPEPSLPIRRIDAPLSKSERCPWRQVINDDHARGVPTDADGGELG